VGGALIMLGLFTRPAAFLCNGLMAAAYWMGYGTAHPLPLVNHGERAALYCFVFLFLATQGHGIWSLDALRASANDPDNRRLRDSP
jgi:putative oxidoreductase